MFGYCTYCDIYFTVNSAFQNLRLGTRTFYFNCPRHNIGERSHFLSVKRKNQEESSLKDAGFLPHTCTGVKRFHTGSDTAHLHHTPAPGPLLGTGSLVSEVHCPDTSPDLSCQKNKPTIGLFLTQRNLSTLA